MQSTHRHARVGSLCGFQDTVERVPTGNLKTGRCTSVQKHCRNGKHRKGGRIKDYGKSIREEAAQRTDYSAARRITKEFIAAFQQNDFKTDIAQSAAEYKLRSPMPRPVRVVVIFMASKNIFKTGCSKRDFLSD